MRIWKYEGVGYGFDGPHKVSCEDEYVLINSEELARRVVDALNLLENKPTDRLGGFHMTDTDPFDNVKMAAARYAFAMSIPNDSREHISDGVEEKSGSYREKMTRDLKQAALDYSRDVVWEVK